ncbi:MAG: cytochrome c biogenesis protein CcsA [Paludibacteraceae bacterium]|nr:cytochrome c biogenesis protein CcsA [Paludibacteraceae bacterium]
MNRLRPIAFSLMGVIILLLIAGSVVEQLCGTTAAIRYVYAAPWTIVLWFGAALSGMTLLLRTQWRQWGTILLHMAFVVILGGALVTHLWGVQGAVELRPGQPVRTFTDKEHDYRTLSFPFTLTLSDFDVLTYPGTDTPRDYVSRLTVHDGGQVTEGEVAMNRIFRYRGWRFCQSHYTAGESVVLLVNRDPWGIGLTYSGYALLLIAMVLFFLQPRSRFRTLLRSALTAATLLVTLSVQAAPQTLPRQQARAMGDLAVFHNGRIQPLSCLATDFTEKLCGRATYAGMTPEQVYAGWLLAPYTWLDEPMFKLKAADRKALHLSGRYATYNQLYYARQQGVTLSPYAEEKTALVQMLLHGELTRIYPYADTAQHTVQWLSPASDLPLGMSDEQWFFIRKSLDYMGELLHEQDYAHIDTLLRKTARYQQVQYARCDAAQDLPSPTRFRAEQLFRRLAYTKPMAMATLTVGLLLFLLYIFVSATGRPMPQWVSRTAWWLLSAEWLVLTVLLGLRWYISGHVPLSNGHETMQALAWLTMLTAVAAARRGRRDLLLTSAWLVSGLALLVSMMTASNPQITSLMPVLQSPLLSLHVTVIMLSYCLLALIAINSIASLVTQAIHPDTRRLTKAMDLSQLLLYPAVFCLAIGIFIGAVWANISWGSYWQWDPKETWALITLLVYAMPLHTTSLRFLQRPVVFHLYCLLAFLAVLFTYFGVNFLLGGMHSYA